MVFGLSDVCFFLFWFSVMTFFLLILLSNQGGVSPLTLYLVEEIASLGLLGVWICGGQSGALVCLVIMKMGLPPFQEWFVNTLEGSSMSSFIWSMTSHKITPGIFWCVFIWSLELHFVIVLAVFGASAILIQKKILGVLVVSSSAILYPVAGLIPSGVGVLFFFLYLMGMGIVMANSETFVEGVFWWLVMAGVPPLLGFQVKWELVERVNSLGWTLMFLISSLGFIVIYLRMLTSPPQSSSSSNFWNWGILTVVYPIL